MVKGTNDVKHFLQASDYEGISEEIHGFLFHTGCILPTQSAGRRELIIMFDLSFDLVKSTPCGPIVDRHSLIAYSVVNKVH